MRSQSILRRGAMTCCIAALTACSAWAAPGAPTIQLEVDATDLPRNLLRSRMTIQTEPGPLDLFFVLWPPGNHAPSGQFQNVVNLEVRDCNGAELRWERDTEAAERIRVQAPQGCDHVQVTMTYIASQPSVTSRSTDSYGAATCGVLNWNTALFYPGGMTIQEIEVAPSLGISPDWQYATSLSVDPQGDRREGALAALTPRPAVNWIDFQVTTLAELVDSPVIMGRHMSVRAMDTRDVPGVERDQPHTFCVVGPNESSIDVPDWLEPLIDRTMREAIALFAPMGFPRERFVFLHVLGDGLNFGVEHAQSTLIGDDASMYQDLSRSDGRAGGAALTVLPHEYFHAWCGKLVAPAGLVRPDFHTPVDSRLLWVYEGLTSYYTSVLAVRGGMITFDEYIHNWAENAAAYERRSGRLWRSVEDTARAARHLRDRGRFWYEMRQGQEYYGQGALFWLEADAIIRRGTNGGRSLDDFCRELFARAPVNPTGAQATYTRADIVRTLADVYGGADWDQIIRERIETPQATLDLSPLLGLAGYTLEMGPTPTELQKKAAKDPANVDLRTSLGFRLNKAGEVVDLVPDSPADLAGLAYGMKAVAVDGWLYSPQRLRESVEATKDSGGVDLLVTIGERVETRRLAYDGGARWPRLERIEGEPDVLRAIAQPLLPSDDGAESKADQKQRPGDE